MGASVNYRGIKLFPTWIHGSKTQRDSFSGIKAITFIVLLIIFTPQKIFKMRLLLSESSCGVSPIPSTGSSPSVYQSMRTGSAQWQGGRDGTTTIP